MAEHLKDTLTEFERLSKIHDTVAVGFSGGKDSLAVLDLSVQHFKHVVPFYFYFVPGLQSEELKLAQAKARYGLEVLQLPSWVGLEALQSGLFCDDRPEFDEMPLLNRRTMFDWIKDKSGATLMIDGEKKADGIFRRRRMGNQKNTMSDVYHPLAEWLKWEVLAFLKGRGIAVPDAGRGDNGSVCLMDSEIIHLHKYWPQDYAIMKSFFPYIETVILRERWFPKAAP